MKKANKYNYLNVIQQNYGFGWEDVSVYECNSQFINLEKSGCFYTDSKGRLKEYYLVGYDLKEYRFTGYATRLINRKELNLIQS
tara:strand:- start:758 stop:1009 length:252 start_codon:yes stop_codon:yes gene_type:complete